MNLRRLLFLAFFSILFDGCGGGSGGGSGSALSLKAAGGICKSSTTNGAGGAGADISIFALGLMTLDAASAPAAPAVSKPPSSGTELTNAMITAGTPIAGNVLVSSTLQIAAGVNPAVITTNTGDVVIRGTLIGERSGGTTTNGITINAPAGTIYVTGSLLTRGTAGAPNNPHGGPVVLTAQRIVVLGTIDSSGLTLTGAAGGNGGSVLFDTTGGGGTDILFTKGKLLASGGDGSPQGGDGGAVTLQAANQLAVHAPITTRGGAGNSVPALAIGGSGGDVTLRGSGSIDLAAALALTGGEASGFVSGAIGGGGGTFAADSAAPYRLFGSIDTSGGESTAHSGASLQAGDAGPINIGVGTPVTTLVMGRGTWTTEGGRGTGSGGNAGKFDIASRDGNLSIQSNLHAFGGESENGSSFGGTAGTVTVKTDADPLGNSSNHSLTLVGNVLARGGDGGPGGTGAAVVLQCGGDLTFRRTIVTSGANATPRDAGPVTLQVSAANLAPTGRIDIVGDILAEGGGPGNGGSGKDILISAAAGITVEGNLQTRGGDFNSNAGNITLQTTTGEVVLAGMFLATPGDMSANTNGIPGNFSVWTPDNITFSGVVDVSGSFALPKNSNVEGTAGGTAGFTCSSPAGSITVLPELLSGKRGRTEIRANGGHSNEGSLNPPGGAGGQILFTTVDKPVTLAGRFLARGGNSSGGDGGLGGQLVVSTDADGNGTGGAITLQSGTEVDVSGGTGLTGGAARNNGGVAPANSNGANLAVILDAGGALVNSPDGGAEGIVRNLGIIIATGGSILGRGGDIWFDGKNAASANLGLGDGGALTLTSPAGNGAFFPN